MSVHTVYENREWQALFTFCQCAGNQARVANRDSRLASQSSCERRQKLRMPCMGGQDWQADCSGMPAGEASKYLDLPDISCCEAEPGQMGMEADGSSLRLRPVQTKPREEGGRELKASVGREGSDSPLEQEAVTPAGRLFLNPNFCCTIFCVLGFERAVDLGAFRRTVAETLAKHKRFRSLPAAGRRGKERWKRVEVRVEDHVVVAELPDAQARSPRVVEDFVADLSIGPGLDRSRPLWDVHVLNYRSGLGEACAVFRIHHSLGDGVSLMSLLVACTRRVGEPESLPNVPVPAASRKGAENWWAVVWGVLVVLWHTVVEVAKFAAMSTFVGDDRTAIKGYAGVEKLPKRIVVGEVSLQEMRDVKVAVGGTVNDVLLGMVGMGLRKYLLLRARKEKAGEEGDVKLPKRMRVRALALVNTRKSPGLQEMAEMMKGSGSQARWGNHMGYLLIPVPLDDYASALDYVRAGKEVGDRKKASLEGPFTYASGSLLIKLGGPEAGAKFTYRSCIQTSMAISNVMGPTEKVMFGDNPVTAIVPTVTGHPQTLCFHLQSYAGKVRLVVTVVESIIPDPETLLQCCVDALHLMKKEALALPSKQ